MGKIDGKVTFMSDDRRKMVSMSEYAVTVDRDGRNLLVRSQLLEGVTPARFPGEIVRMAGDL